MRLLLATVTLAVACGPEPGVRSGPRLELLSDADYDAGVVSLGSTVEHEFSFVNRGEVPVHLDIVRASCACSEVEVRPETVGVGEEGVVYVEIEASSKFGVDAILTVGSTELGNSLLRLRVVVRVDGSERLLVDPGQVTLTWGAGLDRPSETLQVHTFFRGDTTPLLSMAGPSWLDLTPIDESLRALPDGEKELVTRVEVNASLTQRAVGIVTDRIRFSSSRPSIAPAEIGVKLVVEGPLKFTPSTLFLGSGIRTSVKKKIRVAVAEDGTEIGEISCADPRINVQSRRVSESELEVEVVFSPEKGSDRQRLISTSLVFDLPESSPPGASLPVKGWLDETVSSK